MMRRALVLVAAIASVSAASSAFAVGAKDGGDVPPLGTLKPAGDLLVESGQTLAFMGDSITDYGDDMAGGWCRLVIDALRQFGVDVTPLYAGNGGDRSIDMLERLDRHVLAHRPDWMAISVGVNDAWYSVKKARNTLDKLIPLEQFAANVTEIVDRCEKAGTKPILLTPSLIGEDPSNDDNRRLAPYADWVRSFARERSIPLADVNAAMQEAVKTNPVPWLAANRWYTTDGVHMNPRGFRMMARTVLKTIGLSRDEIDSQYDRWMDMPRGWIIDGTMNQRRMEGDKIVGQSTVRAVCAVTPREHQYLETAKPAGPNQLWFIAKEKVIGAQLEEQGGPYESLHELVADPHFAQLQEQMQADADRLVREAVAHAKAAYDAKLSALSDAEREAMATHPHR